MKETIVWEVIPQNEPTIIRNCPKCGGHAVFENSSKFRVNANQSRLDVWLIYTCRKCSTSWKRTLLTRVHPKEIDKEDYMKFLKNNKELARTYAFDTGSYSEDKANLNYDELVFEVKGKDISLEGLENTVCIELSCPYTLDIRLDKILSCKLGVSRETVKKFAQKGYIRYDKGRDIKKAKLKGSMVIEITPYNNQVYQEA